MNRWFNHSHPQTLQAAVILGYLSAVFGVLGWGGVRSAPPLYMVAVFAVMGFGAFGSANNKRWGYYLLAACATLVVVWTIFDFLPGLTVSLSFPLVKYVIVGLTELLFPMALAVAVVHPHSRDYQKIWFE